MRPAIVPPIRSSWGGFSRIGLPEVRFPDLFLPLFGLYAVAGIGLLLIGLLPYFASVSPPVHQQLHAWSTGHGLLANYAGAIIEPAHGNIVSGTGAFIRDYFFSLLQLTLGVFLVWRRPKDKIARLLGLGMVGSGVVYNFYAHEAVFAIYPVFSALSAIHVIYHGLAPAGYLHAIVLFPDGTVAPPWIKWAIPPMYFVMIVFISINVLIYAFAPTSLLPFQEGLTAESLTFFAEVNLAIDVLLIGLFFGLATPLAAVLSQRHRSHSPRSFPIRQQGRLVIWALSGASITSVVVLLAAGTYFTTREGGFSGEVLHHLESVTFQVFPPLFSLIPIALFIAIVRYNLFDIDLVINRTLVYVPLTSTLAGLYIASIGVANSVFTAIAGRTSDAAVAFSTLAVVAAFTPLKNSLQSLVDKRFKEARNPAAEIRRFERDLRAILQVLDPAQVTRRFLDEAARVYEADLATVYMQKDGERQLLYTKGISDDGLLNSQTEAIHRETAGASMLTIPLVCEGQLLGELVLVRRVSARSLTKRDHEALQECAAAVAQAIQLVRQL